MEGAQPCCLPLASVICVSISKHVCTLCVLMAQSAGPLRSKVMLTGFHTGSNQLQWFATAQPLNVHRVVRKNDQEITDFKMALCLPGTHHTTPPSHSLILSSSSSAVWGEKTGWKPHGLRSVDAHPPTDWSECRCSGLDTDGLALTPQARVSVWVTIFTIWVYYFP